VQLRHVLSLLQTGVAPMHDAASDVVHCTHVPFPAPPDRLQTGVGAVHSVERVQVTIGASISEQLLLGLAPAQ
jgi:hypothetical protein